MPGNEKQTLEARAKGTTLKKIMNQRNTKTINKEGPLGKRCKYLMGFFIY
jgi:hypothetical protein